MNYTLLPFSFHGKGEMKGFYFERVYKDQYQYIYCVIDMVDSGIYFERIKRIATPKIIDFKTHESDKNHLVEIYPKARSFGITAWTYKSYQKACVEAEKYLNNRKINN